MRLADLLPDLPAARLEGNGNTSISSIAYDSRSVSPGSLFVAISGQKSDGHDYLARAIGAGAAAVLVQADRSGVWQAITSARECPVLIVPDSRAALAAVAAAFYHHPGRDLGVIGVTGTDGKTSVCHLIDHVLRAGGQTAGLVSTAECRIGEQSLADTGRFTTPEAPELQTMLRQIADAGCRWAVLEATSHGLAQYRLDGSEFDIAAVTTVGSDHLDFHGSVEAYRAAKGRLFQMLDASQRKGIEKTAVLNLDDPSCANFRRLTSARIFTYGLSPQAQFRATDIHRSGWGSRFTLILPERSLEAAITRPGLFNIQNALAAAGVASAAGLDGEAIARGLADWPGAPGRMEIIDEGQPFTVVVDFAHAPDSLRRVLELLRSGLSGRLIAVFGCIGERDKDRRPGMAGVAAELADYTIITDDNPYSENRDEILKDIGSGMIAAGKRSGHDFTIIPDRREAIRHGISIAVDQDTVLLAGKGHEAEVHLGDSSYPCDDRLVARAALKELLGG